MATYSTKIYDGKKWVTVILPNAVRIYDGKKWLYPNTNPTTKPNTYIYDGKKWVAG